MNPFMQSLSQSASAFQRPQSFQSFGRPAAPAPQQQMQPQPQGRAFGFGRQMGQGMDPRMMGGMRQQTGQGPMPQGPMSMNPVFMQLLQRQRMMQ